MKYQCTGVVRFCMCAICILITHCLIIISCFYCATICCFIVKCAHISIILIFTGMYVAIYVPCLLGQELDDNLFHSSRYNPHHVLHRLLLQPKDTGYKLRQRAHNLTLPSDVNSTTKQNFIFRMLFDDMY